MPTINNNRLYLNKTNLRLAIEAFFSVWGISRACGLSARSILPLILFAGFVFFFRYVSALSISNRIHFTSAGTAFLFTVLYLLADWKTLTDGLNNRFFQTIILFSGGIGLFLLFYYFLILIFTYLSRYFFPVETSPLRLLPLISFAFSIICWLPYFLYEYPGIMTPDSINQFEQILGMVPYSNHHPWVHTIIIKFFYSIGCIFTNDRNAALAFFTVFQMCFMAFCISWLISTMQRLRIKNAVCLAVTAFYSLIPYHAVFAVTIWKDIMFSGTVLLFTTTLLRLLFIRHTSKKEFLFSTLLYILSGIMMCLLRTNGWYAFLFSIPFLVYSFRRRIKVMLIVHIPILAAVLIIKLAVMNAYDVIQPDFTESICIPLQQVARVICEDRELTKEEWESVHKVIDTTYIKELYSPGFADNMKELVRAGNPQYLENNKSEYLRLWISLGLRYPADYLQAHIDQTIGYWFPDVAYTVGDIDGIIANQTGVYSNPLIGGPVIVKIKEILLKLSDMLPLYGLLSSTGFMFWVLICCLAITIIKQEYGRIILFLPGLAVILTLFIATPVSSEFRYAYSLACTLPLYLLIPCLRTEVCSRL